MKRNALIVVAAVVGAVLAGYLLRDSPIPVSGGESAQAVTSIDRSIITQIEAQEALTAPVVPVEVLVTPAVPAPAVAESVVIQPSLDPNELRAIDAYAAAERQKIEAWYSEEVAKLKANLEQRMQHLSEANKLAWAQFYQQANETWSTTSGHDSGSAHTYDYGYGASSSYSGWRSEITRTYVVGDPAGDYAATVARIKNSRQATQEDFTKAQKELDWLRQNKLARVQAEVDRRQMEVSRRKAAIALRKARAETETARREAGDPTPRVEAVMGGAGGRYQALIGDDLVPEGAAVRGYRVKRILASSVEFEKDGQTWVQRVD